MTNIKAVPKSLQESGSEPPVHKDLFSSCTVYTSTVSYTGMDRLDITVKSAGYIGRYFAPTWDMVQAYKSGKMSEEEYRNEYNKIIQAVPQHIWDKVLSMVTVVLVCYCPDGNFCHRYIVADELVKRGAKYAHELPANL